MLRSYARPWIAAVSWAMEWNAPVPVSRAPKLLLVSEAMKRLAPPEPPPPPEPLAQTPRGLARAVSRPGQSMAVPMLEPPVAVQPALVWMPMTWPLARLTMGEPEL